MSYTESRRYYTQKPLITYARNSSVDSRASASTRSSGEGYYTSSRTSSSSMANSGYADSSPSRSTDSARSVYRRVPDSEGYYTTSTTSSSGKVETHNHGKPRYDSAEPTPKDARYEEFNRPADSRRIQDRRSQSSRSS